MNALRNSRLVSGFFYSNCFYGVCAVALTIEAMLQQRYPLNGPAYFFAVFIVTVLYYTYPYVRKSMPASRNPRTRWYAAHFRQVVWSQVIITTVLVLMCIVFIVRYHNNLLHMPLLHWILLGIFPLVAACYYGIDAATGSLNLRKTGWSKPFVIGFTWAGLVTVYPLLYSNIIHGTSFHPVLINVLLFMKNLMFVTVLCILFDIKDYASDYLNRLTTFIVRVGLRKTIFYLVIPLSAAGLATFIYYGVSQHFSFMKMLLNSIPFILLMMAAYSLRRRKSLLYYLVVIDGLMLLKAICGSIAMLYF